MATRNEYWEAKFSTDKYAWGPGPSDVAERLRGYAQPGKRFLDVGCGCGRDALYFATLGSDAVGIDWSEEGIRQGRELTERSGAGGKAKFIIGDYRHLVDFFEPGSFDVISSYNAFHLLEECYRAGTFQQLRDLLAPGGLLAFEVFSTRESGFGDGVQSEHNTFVKKGQRVHFFEDKEILALTDGLEVVQIEHIEAAEDYPNHHKHQEWLYIGRRPA